MLESFIVLLKKNRRDIYLKGFGPGQQRSSKHEVIALPYFIVLFIVVTKLSSKYYCLFQMNRFQVTWLA